MPIVGVPRALSNPPRNTFNKIGGSSFATYSDVSKILPTHEPWRVISCTPSGGTIAVTVCVPSDTVSWRDSAPSGDLIADA